MWDFWYCPVAATLYISYIIFMSSKDLNTQGPYQMVIDPREKKT